MFLTVALPVFNVENYLHECIQSILEQTMTDFEILLVDDGSTDRSPQICDECCQKYPSKIRVIHNPNMGSLLTRRCCIDNARGEYIHIMDSDDKLIDIHAYEKIRSTLLDSESDMVFFLCTRDENKKSPYKSFEFENKQIFEDRSMLLLEYLFLDGTSMNALWNKVFKCSIIDHDDDYSKYDEVINGTDVFQMLPIFSNASRIVFLKEVLYYYRVTEGSIGRHFNPKMYAAIKANSLRLEKYMKLWGLGCDESADKKLKVKRLGGCTTAANRVKFCSHEQKRLAIDYLKEISNDSYFLNVFKYHKYLELKKRGIAYLLKLKAYTLIWYIVRMIR